MLVVYHLKIHSVNKYCWVLYRSKALCLVLDFSLLPIVLNHSPILVLTCSFYSAWYHVNRNVCFLEPWPCCAKSHRTVIQWLAWSCTRTTCMYILICISDSNKAQYDRWVPKLLLNICLSNYYWTYVWVINIL